MQAEQNPYSPPDSLIVEPTPSGGSQPVPALWNPNAAANWSLLFSPVFGAWLQRANWLALGEPEQARESRNWILISFFAIVGISVAAVVFPSVLLEALSRVSGLVILLTWYFMNGRRQVRYVKQHFGREYPRRGWLQPLVLAVVLFVAFMILVAAVTFVIAVATNLGGSQVPL